MIKKIKEDFNIKYTEDFLNSDELILTFFSKAKLPENSRLFRRYIKEITRRQYFPSGAKRWLYTLAYMYEVRIPKDMFEINVDDCFFSYISYNLKGIDVGVLNNTSAGSGCDLGDGTTGSVTFQGKFVHHCQYIGARDAKKILSIALDNPSGTFEKSDDITYFNGSFSEIMFIAKYAPTSTNFNKSNYRYSMFKRTENRFVNRVLGSKVDKDIVKCIEDYIKEMDYDKKLATPKSGNHDELVKLEEKRRLEKNMGEEIIKDLNTWLKIESETFYGLPVELFDAMQSIKSFARTKKGRFK